MIARALGAADPTSGGRTEAGGVVHAVTRLRALGGWRSRPASRRSFRPRSCAGSQRGPFNRRSGVGGAGGSGVTRSPATVRPMPRGRHAGSNRTRRSGGRGVAHSHRASGPAAREPSQPAIGTAHRAARSRPERRTTFAELEREATLLRDRSPTPDSRVRSRPRHAGSATTEDGSSNGLRASCGIATARRASAGTGVSPTATGWSGARIRRSGSAGARCTFSERRGAPRRGSPAG